MPSQRETQKSGSLQIWKGVDQRTQPTLVEDGSFIFSGGTIFGFSDGGAERLSGKQLAGKVSLPIVSITQFGDITLIQQLNKLTMVPTADLINFTV